MYNIDVQAGLDLLLKKDQDRIDYMLIPFNLACSRPNTQINQCENKCICRYT